MANVGSADKVIRLMLGLILLAVPFLPFTASIFADWGMWTFLVSAAGLIFIATALMNFCPVYRLFGISTRP